MAIYTDITRIIHTQLRSPTKLNTSMQSFFHLLMQH